MELLTNEPAQSAELYDATQMYYYGARYYDPRISIFVSVDPLAEKTMEPYLYTGNNPIMFTDPTGMNADPIYGANWLGDVKWIGDDGKDDGKSYFVTGKTQSAVEKATKKGGFYEGSLDQSDEVMHVPTGNILKDVQKSVDATVSGSDKIENRVEHGAHALNGDTNARHWDKGSPREYSKVTTPDGLVTVTERWSIKPFLIGGEKNQVGGKISNISFIWHTHPRGSDPSPNDINGIKSWRNSGFKGNTFLIDTNNNKVNFFNERGTIRKVNYSDFIRMGNREIIK